MNVSKGWEFTKGKHKPNIERNSCKNYWVLWCRKHPCLSCSSIQKMRCCSKDFPVSPTIIKYQKTVHALERRRERATHVAALSTRPAKLLLTNQTWRITSQALLWVERCVHPADPLQTGASHALSTRRLPKPLGWAGKLAPHCGVQIARRASPRVARPHPSSNGLAHLPISNAY